MTNEKKPTFTIEEAAEQLSPEDFWLEIIPHFMPRNEILEPATVNALERSDLVERVLSLQAELQHIREVVPMLLDVTPLKERQELLDLAIEAKQRRLPLRIRQVRHQAAKELAQYLAAWRWRFCDADQEIKTGEMLQLVWNEMVELRNADLLDGMPDKAEGLRKWINKVAPPYAKKGGRPRKKKT